MTEKIVLDSVLKIPVSLANQEAILHHLTTENPAYLTAVKYNVKTAESIPQFLEFYTDKGEAFEVPRNFRFGLKSTLSIYSTINNKNTGLPLGEPYMEDRIKLREYQEEYLSKIAGEETDFILSAPCGHGKTVMALYLTAKRGVRTLTLVPNSYLAKQWFKSVKALLTAKVVIWKSTTKLQEIKDADFVIGTYDILNARDRLFQTGELSYSMFGQVIVDEAHRIGASTYYPIISRFPSMYRLALSATFRRADGIDKILGYSFGKLYPLKSQFPKVRTYLWDLGYVDEDFDGYSPVVSVPQHLTLTAVTLTEKFPGSEIFFLPPGKVKGDKGSTLLYLHDPDRVMDSPASLWHYTPLEQAVFRLIEKRSGDPSFVNLDSFTSEHPVYIAWLARLTDNLIKKGRRPLVLSKRLSLIQKVVNVLYQRGYTKEDLCVITGNKEYQSLASSEPTDATKAVLGIAQLANEGLDIDWLDSLVIAHPIKDMEQAYGRVRRYVPGKPEPIAIQPYNWSKDYHLLQNFSKDYFKENSHPPVVVKTLPV